MQTNNHNNNKKVTILANLGTPDAPTSSALRRYLAEFLSDPRVVEIPKIIWRAILYLFILPFRSSKSARLYQNIWTSDGSPLLTGSTKLAEEVNKHADHLVIAAMRYGNPAIKKSILTLVEQGFEEINILPLYPQYSATSTGSVYDACCDALKTIRHLPSFRITQSYYNHPLYIDALAASVDKAFSEHGTPDCLLISFHGIPKRCTDLGDPYDQHCEASASLLAEKLELSPEQWKICYQSRFGKAQWLEPSTDIVLAELAKAGANNVMVICPGFAVDCLETLDEIDRESRHVFMENGGKFFYYIPALNHKEAHVQLIRSLIN
ncbi:MAG: ferrochelatase [bacterium]